MKIKKISCIILLIVISTGFCEKQLFEALMNEEENNKLNTNEVNLIEKKTSKINKLKIKPPGYYGGRLQNKIRYNEQEIQRLEKKLANLLMMNKKLQSDAHKSNKFLSNRNMISDKIVMFLQKEDQKLKTFEKSFQSQKSNIDNQVNSKVKELATLKNSVSSQLSSLRTKIEEMKTNLENISRMQNTHIEKLSEKLQVNTMHVSEKLHVDGSANISEINANRLILQNLKMEKSKITFYNENTKIIVKNNIITIKQLMQGIQTMLNVQKRCGSRFENCMLLSDNYLKEKLEKENEILKMLNTLKSSSDYAYQQ